MDSFGIVDLILILVSVILGLLTGAAFSERVKSLIPFYRFENKLNLDGGFFDGRNKVEKIKVASLERSVENIKSEWVKDEAEEDLDIDVHALNRIPPKKSLKVKAKIRFRGRGKPMKYDLSDYDFDEENE
jgi:hypothetical protein